MNRLPLTIGPDLKDEHSFYALRRGTPEWDQALLELRAALEENHLETTPGDLRQEHGGESWCYLGSTVGTLTRPSRATHHDLVLVHRWTHRNHPTALRRVDLRVQSTDNAQLAANQAQGRKVAL